MRDTDWLVSSQDITFIFAGSVGYGLASTFATAGMASATNIHPGAWRRCRSPVQTLHQSSWVLALRMTFSVQRAAQKIGAAGGRIRHDQMNWLGRIALRAGARRREKRAYGKHCGDRRGHFQKVSGHRRAP
jgi:hypothetical protein